MVIKVQVWIAKIDHTFYEKGDFLKKNNGLLCETGAFSGIRGAKELGIEKFRDL